MKMNYYLSLFLFSLCIVNIYSQELDRFPKYPDESFNHPPGALWLNDHTFLDETEIANIHWLEFLHYVKIDSSDIYYKKVLPDTLLLPETLQEILASSQAKEIKMLFNPSYFLGFDGYNYLRYPGFRYYPVVGVSYEQALAYCNWRSNVVNAKINEDEDNAGSEYRTYFRYRLPTEKEWELGTTRYIHDSISLYFGNYNDKTLRKFKYKKKNLKHNTFVLNDDSLKQWTTKFDKSTEFNISHKRDRPTFINDSIYFLSKNNFPTYIYDAPANSNGFYNLVGSVAEMIDEKGIAKGGSWLHEAEECHIKKQQYFEHPTAWLGFRCACDVATVHKDSANPFAPLEVHLPALNYRELMEKRAKDSIATVIKKNINALRPQFSTIIFNSLPLSEYPYQYDYETFVQAENDTVKLLLPSYFGFEISINDSILKKYPNAEIKLKSVEIDIIRSNRLLSTSRSSDYYFLILPSTLPDDKTTVIIEYQITENERVIAEEKAGFFEEDIEVK